MNNNIIGNPNTLTDLSKSKMIGMLNPMNSSKLVKISFC